jgi:asparagine synthetase A
MRVKIDSLINYKRPFNFNILYLLLKRKYPSLKKEEFEALFYKNIGRIFFKGIHFKVSHKQAHEDGSTEAQKHTSTRVKKIYFYKKHIPLIEKVLKRYYLNQ